MTTKLQEEIKQTKPFESTSQEAFLALVKTTDQLRRDLGRMLETSGITMQQYNVLRILRGAGDTGLPTLEIADRMIEQTPGITRLIDRLEERGLVLRNRSLEDRRQVICKITDSGEALLSALDQPVLNWLNRALNLPDNELKCLIQALDHLRELQEPVRIGFAEHRNGYTQRSDAN